MYRYILAYTESTTTKISPHKVNTNRPLVLRLWCKLEPFFTALRKKMAELNTQLYTTQLREGVSLKKIYNFFPYNHHKALFSMILLSESLVSL